MRNRGFAIFFLVLYLDWAGLSQTKDRPSAFISAHMGGFLSANQDFSKTYDSQLGFVYGGTLALPLSAEAFLYGKVTYFSKSGVAVRYTYTLQNGVLVRSSESRDGTSNFKQWIINFGSLYDLTLSENLLLGVSGGLTYSRISEEQQSQQGASSSSLTASGILGLFGGVGLERRFPESQLSGFVEGQYNLSWPILSSMVGNYGGLNLSLGIRFYFRDSRIR